MLKIGYLKLVVQRVKLFNTVELQRLKQAWDHENWFQSTVIPTRQGKFPESSVWGFYGQRFRAGIYIK